LRALTFGPLGYDVELINKALAGFGTNETLLTELLLGRPAFEVRWLKKGYKARFGRDLTDAVKSDLSGKLERSECSLPSLCDECLNVENSVYHGAERPKAQRL